MAETSWLRPTVRRVTGVWIVIAFLVGAAAIYWMGPDLADPVGSTSNADGIGTTKPGILLTVTPSSDATLDVTELVRLDAPTTSISVRPPDFSAAGSSFTAEKPYASKVRIVALDEPVPVVDGIVNRAQTLDLDAPMRRYEMRYELNRAVVRSLPSTTGRALGAIRPLTSDVRGSLPVAVVAVGEAVRNLSCPALELPDQACATGSPPLLRVSPDLPWRTAVVVLQLDLARPDRAGLEDTP